MLDRYLHPIVDRPLSVVAQALVKMGVKADEITWVGFLLGIAAGIAIIVQYTGLACIFFLLNRLADGLDGAVARATKPTDFGAYLDVTLDLMVYAWLPLAFALVNPDFRLPAVFLTACFVASSTSHLAHGFFRLKHGDQIIEGKYTSLLANGLVGGAESIAFFTLFFLFPPTFEWGAWLFGGLCLLTAFGRLFAANEAARDE